MHSIHASPPDQHRSKRKFQPSITSYFALRDNFDQDDHLRGIDPPTRSRQHHQVHQHHQQHHYHQHHPHNVIAAQRPRESLVPNLPGQVQTELLTVGMRVRKAVPEGYKTQKLMSGLPSITTTLVTTSTPTYDVKPSLDTRSGMLVHKRELLPFCSLNKVADYAEQPTTNIHLYGGLDSHGQPATNAFPLSADTFTQPFSSHGAADSGYMTASQRLPNPLNPSKRSWQDDDEVRPLNTDLFFAMSKGNMNVEVDEVPVSPLSETPPTMLPQVRHFAQPKSRRQEQPTPSSEMDMDMDMTLDDVTQLERRIAVGSGSDFGEADFLAQEVHMGGI